MCRHIAIVSILAASLAGAAFAQEGARSRRGLEREVRHELILLPYYGVFDNLAFQVEGSRVTLLGEVTRPSLKNDAESAVKNIEGVTAVDNKIEVLPPSSNDDRIRLAAYRAIYGQASLSRYAMEAVPPIHIIVKNGRINLVGSVANQGDKDLAGIRAKGVSGVFAVDNNLSVEK